MEGKKKTPEQSSKNKDLGRTAVQEMPNGFEDPLLKSQEQESDVFEIDLDEVETDTVKKNELQQAREQVNQTMSGPDLPQADDPDPVGLVSEIRNPLEQSGLVLEDSQGATILGEELDEIPNYEFDYSPASDLESTQRLDKPDFARKLKPEPEDMPGEIAEQYTKLSSEQIESLTLELRQELVDIANTSESAKEILEKQNGFILEHAKKLGFPESLALRLIADGRRILPIAPLATQGGMSAVFESLNLNSDASILFGVKSEFDVDQQPQTDVLKVIYSANAEESFLERFQQEAIAAANLNTKEKRIVNVRDADFESPESGYFMVLEKAEGNDLKQEIKEKKLPPKKAIGYGIEIAQALKSVHEAGIIHRDVKPENVFIHREMLNNNTVRESVKLADFGLIKIGSEMQNQNNETVVEDLSLSNPGTIMGSPVYQAPEILTQQAEESPQTDIYSLGVTLYQLMTKKLPYVEMSSFKELVSSASEGNVVDLKDLTKKQEYADIPLDLALLIDEMIDVDPSMRPGIDEIIERLEQINNLQEEQPVQPDREAAQGGRIPVIKEEDVQSKGFLSKLFSRKK